MNSSITWGKKILLLSQCPTHTTYSHSSVTFLLYSISTKLLLGQGQNSVTAILFLTDLKIELSTSEYVKKNWFKVHCTSHLMTYETENLQCKLLAFTTGYPICLVQVVITSRTGFPLAFPRDSHRSSVTAFLYLNFVRYWFMPFLKLWKTIKSFVYQKVISELYHVFYKNILPPPFLWEFIVCINHISDVVLLITYLLYLFDKRLHNACQMYHLVCSLQHRYVTSL